jgi:ribosome-associated toxin RatA of RatAB toxin-antitoxin module
VSLVTQGETNVNVAAALQGREADCSPRPSFCAQRRRLLVGAAALAGATLAGTARSMPRSPADRPVPSLDVERRGREIVVHAQAEVEATLALAFSTLVDYDRLAEFIPNIATSRTVSRNGSNALIEQRGRAGFGPFGQQFTLILAIEEEPFASIRASAVGGDFRRFDAIYQLASIDEETTRLVYRASFEPTTAVPPLFGLSIMRGLVRRQFEAMVSEIARRSAAG